MMATSVLKGRVWLSLGFRLRLMNRVKVARVLWGVSLGFGF